MVERPHLARVEALAEGMVGDVVLVLAVLAVEQLRRHDDRCRAVEQRDLEREHRQVPVGEADETLRPDAHPLAGGRAPHEVAGEDAVAEVEHPLVRLEVGVAHQQRLVVDVQLHQLGVGHVDDRLAGLGEAERLLGVADVPGLVEAVDERAVAVRVAPLLGVGAHADVAVGDGEQRLGERRGRRRRTRARRSRHGSVGKRCRSRWSGAVRLIDAFVQQLGEVVDDDVGTVGMQRFVTGAAIDADDQAETAGPAGGHSGHRVLDDDRLRRLHAEAVGGGEEQVGRRLAGDVLGRGEHAVGDDVESRRQPGRLEHLAARCATTTPRRPSCRAIPGGRGSGPSRGTARSPPRAGSSGTRRSCGCRAR